MMDKKKLYIELLEIANNNVPPFKNYLDISIDKGKMLAKEYNANLEIV